MLKLIFFIGLVYIGIKVFTLWKRLNAAVNRTVPGQAKGVIDDVMVKDPYCNVYFPKRNGISLKSNGQVFYFCSKECKERFVQEMNSK
jgi:uncharacterized protein